MLKNDPDPGAEPHKPDDRQNKVSENMIKTAILARAVIFFFLAAFFLTIALHTLVAPHEDESAPTVLAGIVVLGSVLLPSLALAFWDARRQSRKYFGSKR